MYSLEIFLLTKAFIPTLFFCTFFSLLHGKWIIFNTFKCLKYKYYNNISLISALLIGLLVSLAPNYTFLCILQKSSSWPKHLYQHYSLVPNFHYYKKNDDISFKYYNNISLIPALIIGLIYSPALNNTFLCILRKSSYWPKHLYQHYFFAPFFYHYKKNGLYLICSNV